MVGGQIKNDLLSIAQIEGGNRHVLYDKSYVALIVREPI